MSRGHGPMQQRILRQLSPGIWTPSNVLQWQLAGATSDLSDAFANSFGRALNLLERDEVIRIHQRGLMSFGEAIDVFPSRSRSLEVMTLRQRLLPLLAKFQPQRPGYGLADNERHVLETENNLRWREERWRTITAGWTQLENELYVLLGAKAAPRHLLVDVITRGRDLFSRSSPITHRAPLGPMLKKLIHAYRNAAKAEPPVLGRLMRYYAEHVPRDARVSARLLSKLLDVAEVASRGADTIRREAAKFLLSRDPTYIRSLPGHSEPQPSRPFRGAASWNQDPIFSPLLNKLLTKEVLSEFRFVTAIA